MIATARAVRRDPILTAPSSADELLARSGQVALELSGADQSAWSGRVIETTGSILGLAHWDGTLYLDRECILDPLQRMYEHAGEEQPIPMLVHYRESLATLLHEHAHFLGPAGASQDAARDAFTQPGGRQLEEGVAEAWAQDHLDDYLTRLGVDKVAPGIKDVQAGGYYAAFVPAVRRLATDLEIRNDLRPGQVLDVLNRETAAGQFPLLVSLVYNSTRLPDLELAGADTRHHLESILRTGLGHLDNFELHPPGFAAAKSHSTAGELLHHLHQEIQTAESAYTFHPTACTLPPPSTTPARTSPSPPTPPPPTRLALPTPSSVVPAHGGALSDPHAFQAALSGICPPRPIPADAPTVQSTAPPRSTGVPAAQRRSPGSRGRRPGVG
ncbi:hypothetical protein OG558_10850 [Kribbella sp. NBC_01510]|uniref:hypothetical protein n=1 Tax=Kribbella sp. NBC_01510 TaxID=2903581 RepID=UPI00386875DC